MATDIDAVIAALRVALDEAEKNDDEHWWKVRNANRWIRQLPGTFFGRWRHLKLSGDIGREIQRERFIGHVKATIAFLETNREAIETTSRMRWWSRPTARSASPSVPVEAEFTDVTPKRRKGVRLIK